MPGDVDELAGETLEQKGAAAASQLQTAVAEQLELRSPARLAISAVEAVAGSIMFLLLLWAVRRGHRVLSVKMPEGAEQKLQQFSVVEDLQLVQATKAVEILRGFISLVAASVALFLIYSWVTFVLRRFPYTRPWGESLREFLLTRLGAVALAIIHWIPDLFTIIIIVLITRAASRFIYVLFAAVEQDRLHVPGVYPETASPTRRLVIGLLWIVALVASYPYLPGSQSEAFKGVSVFIGLVISLGSSGIVGQAMSGFTLTYSRAVRLGDFVRIGDVEGTVAHLGSLSTKIKTERREDVTIPNSVVVATPITNYSRFADVEGVFNAITVTIGYDVPWRQIQAMLCWPRNVRPTSSEIQHRLFDKAVWVMSLSSTRFLCASSSRRFARRLWERCAPTSLMSSTNSACRSWCPATKGIRLRPRSSGERSGSPRRRRHAGAI